MCHEKMGVKMRCFSLSYVYDSHCTTISINKCAMKCLDSQLKWADVVSCLALESVALVL